MNEEFKNEEIKRQANKEEPKLLSIILRDQDALMDAISLPLTTGKEGHFWGSDSSFLWTIIKTYYDEYSKPLTRTAMDSIMDSMSAIKGSVITDDDRTAARMYWDKVYGMSTPIDDYDLLKSNINNRRLQQIGYGIMRDGIDKIAKATNNQEEILKNVKEKFLMIDGFDIDNYCLTMGMDEGVDVSLAHIKRRRENPKEVETVMTGIQGIDDVYHGFHRGSYNIIAGMINGGKTTLMFNIAFNMAKRGESVVFVSIEKEAKLFFLRLLSLHALVDYNRIKVGGSVEGGKGLPDYYYQKYLDAGEDLTNNIHPNLDCIQMPVGIKMSKIISEIEKIKARKKIDVIFVDYLGVIGFETHHPGRPDLDEARVSQRLQGYGRINRFVTITASQLKTPSVKEIRNKAKKATTEDASSVEINTEDFSGSKMIIADADNALGVVLNGDSPPSKMYVYGTKARDDEARRRIVLDFDGALGRVADQEFEPGQITAVDQLIYDGDVSEADLASDDGLFTMKTGDELDDNDFDFSANTPTKEEEKVTVPALSEEVEKNSGHVPMDFDSPDQDDPDDLFNN